MRNFSKYLIILTAFIVVSVMLSSCGKESQTEEEPKIVEQEFVQMSILQIIQILFAMPTKLVV